MTEREQAAALYTFLRELAQLRTRTIRDISSYERDGQVIWAADIPHDPGCDCIAWHRDAPDAAEEIWLEIRKPRLTRPPTPPDVVSAWVQRDQLDDSSRDFPELSSTLVQDSAEDPPLRLGDHPEVQTAWDRYIEDHWWAWAERDRREKPVQRVYTDLYSMFQRQQGLGEDFEIIFGLGLLNWRLPSGHLVRRHLIVARVTVEFDATSGTLTVTPAGGGAQPSIELDMLDPQHHPSPEMLRSMGEALEQIGDRVWEAGPLDGLLKSWVHSVSARGDYSDSLDRPDDAGAAPVIQLAPALVLRKRTERSFIRAYDDIITQIEAGEPVPEGVSRFIRVAEEGGRDGLPRENGHGRAPGETFFPLPANDAQIQIVERLAANQGVLVQGPPGTGKSHTIVNLICHALASGQRVLVTSHTARALKVLRRMIKDQAPDLAPLSVVLLGDDREALNAMEESVQGITGRQNTWDVAKSEQTIVRLERELDQRRRREAMVLSELREIRERETYRHDAKFGYTGTLARIGQTLRDQRESLSWIPDRAPEDIEPLLNAAEFEELIALLRDADVSRWGPGGWVSIDVSGLPTAETFELAVEAERQASTAYESEAPVRERAEYSALEALPSEDRIALTRGLDEIIQLVNRIDQRPLPWAGMAARQILGDFDLTWRKLRDDTSHFVESNAGLASWLDRNSISPPLATDLQEVCGDAEALLQHLRDGGGWGNRVRRDAVVKRGLYVRELRVGGRVCNTAETIGDLVKRLRADIESRHLRERWARHHDLAATTFSDLVAELEDLCEPLDEAFTARAKAQELSAIVSGTPGGLEPAWADPASLGHLNATAAACETAERHEAAARQIDQTVAYLRAQSLQRRSDPALQELQTAVTERDTLSYARARERAAGNIELEAKLRHRRALLGRVEASAPQLATELKAAPADAVWDGRARNFERAWNWRRAEGWLTRLVSPDADQQHRRELETTRKLIAHVLERLAAEKAWTHCFERMTRKEREHLVAWSKAVQRIGKGTGKYAPQHRREAREHLNQSRSAIPAWVMPLHRVAETIKPGSELFDVAIIDEASQSGPEALLLAYLAKKLVVVGDDKQIQPTSFANRQNVNQLRERYLAGLPHADVYGANQSFFDLAEIRYEGRIRLREHFRCMPEIIQFSNNLSYQGEPLIPLRQYGAARLEPAITTTHVKDGYQQGTASRAVNPPEAEALVDRIVGVCQDPAYHGKTIGVISLLGSAQAREIEGRLLRELGPEEMQRLQIVCGDAYAFQGDERDVMFLSMVSAPGDGRRIGALTDAAAQRRFNVAASRARDQLFLFHTATLDDLSPHCMRYKLLEYCQDPKTEQPPIEGVDLPGLERRAFQADRQRETPPPPFDSWFELDVFLRISSRGYRVIPQHPVGPYRIDLVVQGLEGSLAVECDGDAWHGAERYEEDVARQRILERCGWTFWRVPESIFRLDPDGALSDLWTTLEDLGIFPTAEEERRHRETQDAAERRSAAPAERTDRPDQTREGAPSTKSATRSTRPVAAPRPSEPAEGAAASSFLDQLAKEAERAARADEATGPKHPTVSPTDSQSTGQTAESQGVTRVAGAPSAPGPLPALRPAAPTQPTLESSRPDISPTDTARDDWLAPYVQWTPDGSVPDPRTASQDELVALLAEVVDREGPVVAIRAYRLINLASGSRRLTGPARQALNRACAAAVRAGAMTATNPFKEPGQAQLVLRRRGSREILLRERGPRELDELPPDEVKAMSTILRDRTPELDREALKRQLMERLGWLRLAKNVSSFLDRCIDLP